MSELIKLEIKNKIATVTLNRPEKKNALTLEMLITLSNIGDNLKEKTSLKCIIINGSGGTFCSGIDITSFASLASDKKLLNSIMAPLDGASYNQIQKSCLIWQEISIPVIAVLEGPVFGAGLQLALGADIRIAAFNTVLSIMETKWGLIPDMGITQTLPKLISYDQAFYATLTSNLIEANEAKSLGLVTICSENPYDESMKWVRGISSRSPEAIVATKTLYKKAWSEKTVENLRLEALLQTKLIGSTNQMEAVLANIENRPPNFVPIEQ